MRNFSSSDDPTYSEEQKIFTEKNLVVTFITHQFVNISVRDLPQDTENYKWIVRVSGLEKYHQNDMTYYVTGHVK